MSDDFLHKVLQSSMDREARKMASNGGVTEQDRYGNLLDCVNGRDLENEEVNKQLDRLSAMHKNAEERRKQREKESAEWSRNMRQIVKDVENREQNRVNDVLVILINSHVRVKGNVRYLNRRQVHLNFIRQNVFIRMI